MLGAVQFGRVRGILGELSSLISLDADLRWYADMVSRARLASHRSICKFCPSLCHSSTAPGYTISPQCIVSIYNSLPCRDCACLVSRMGESSFLFAEAAWNIFAL